MPGALDKVSKILKMGEKGKKEGGKLIALFTSPRPIRKRKKQIEIDFPGVFNDWNSHPKEWAEFEAYNIQDVEVEADLWFKFLPLSFPEEQWEDYFLDQEINDFGLPINLVRAEKALRLAERYKAWAFEEMKRLTGLKNPNSPKHQLLPWLQKQGYPWGSINKQFVGPLLEQLKTEGGNVLTMEANEVLALRAKSAQSSYTKLQRLVDETGPDGFLRYQFSYMGASRTGRQSSHGFQAQNMPRPIKSVKKNPERALQLVDAEDYDTIMKENDNSTLPFVASIIRMCVEVQE
jgi:DNA polymerase